MALPRVVLISGTSHAGTSSSAALVAQRLGYACRSTDQLARHPGRPWRTAEREVPPHVAEHYAHLPVEELLASVLDHYDHLAPRIRGLVTAHLAGAGGGDGLVLEGSALRPALIAGLSGSRVAAVRLVASPDVLDERIRREARAGVRTAAEHHLVDQFVARSLRFQSLMDAEAHGTGLALIDTSTRSPAQATDLIIAAAP
ncbi:hypothetical protein [Ruania halotolerans]|uniref:hypothetical protein n=1 Tax=Ruania halotolerans TaxID=2897773 RepID=UPI001E4BB150|nr:hypothetical protein [Ruania halotolerans]UFU07328.1 hypothetical protein LQF10_04240 [Ruania halotolerans]